MKLVDPSALPDSSSEATLLACCEQFLLGHATSEIGFGGSSGAASLYLQTYHIFATKNRDALEQRPLSDIKKDFCKEIFCLKIQLHLKKNFFRHLKGIRKKGRFRRSDKLCKLKYTGKTKVINLAN